MRQYVVHRGIESEKRKTNHDNHRLGQHSSRTRQRAFHVKALLDKELAVAGLAEELLQPVLVVRPRLPVPPRQLVVFQEDLREWQGALLTN